MDDVIKLLSTTYEKNKYGQDIPVNTAREVFCDKKSVSRNEFFNAGRNGLNPQYVFTVFKGEYSGESICEYNGLTYSIYRTYESDDDYIELYVERKGGTNGEESNSG
jgi:SPP1 family predicted phage head-tail adaptor